MTDQRVREKFEAWISAPPMELCVDRFNADHPSWPNCYKNYNVHIAWDAWQAAIPQISASEITVVNNSVPKLVDSGFGIGICLLDLVLL